MTKFILHPTDTSQWHALVNDAQHSFTQPLSEDLESYLVFLLMRFTNEPEATSSILAMDFLQSHDAIGQLRSEQLRNVGDKSLLYSGLFPGIANKRQVKLSYFVELGQTAYGLVSSMGEQGTADLYAELADNFIVLLDVLQHIRLMGEAGAMDPLQAEELYNATGDPAALEILKYYVDKKKN